MLSVTLVKIAKMPLPLGVGAVVGSLLGIGAASSGSIPPPQGVVVSTTLPGTTMPTRQCDLACARALPPSTQIAVAAPVCTGLPPDVTPATYQVIIAARTSDHCPGRLVESRTGTQR